jgi:hypothetical protein
MIKTVVYLSAELASRMRRLIRAALAGFAHGNPRPLPPGVGRYRSGRSDVSQRADEILGCAAKQGRGR